MELINNRYRVIRVLGQTYQLTSYLVADIIRNHKLLCINILNADNISSTVVDFFNNEFLKLKSLNSSGLINLLQYGLVTTIDNKKLKEYRYFYSTEYCETDIDIINHYRNHGFYEKLDLFMELCSTVNALHLKGHVYDAIRPSNTYQDNSKNSGVKIKDLATVYVEGFDLWKTNVREAYYRAPEISKEHSGTTLSDIYSLGMFMMKFFNLEECLINPEGLVLDECSQEGRLENKLLKIAERMIQQNPEKRYSSINEVVRTVNDEFETTFKAFSIENMERLNFNTQLIGRDYPKLEVIKAYNIMLRNQQGRIIGIHGEAGIGKTRLLREIRYVLKMSRARVYTAFVTESNKGPVEILKKMISECSRNILQKYEQELVRFIPEISGSKHISELVTVRDKERFRLLNRLTSFVTEFVKDNPTVIIIDNLHFYSSFFIELVEHIYSNSIDNLLVVFSCDDGEYASAERFQSMLSRLSLGGSYSSIKLSPLTEAETAALVKNVLSLPKTTPRFAKRIYSHTYGNPLFIEEVIKNLFARRELYIDAEAGLWAVDYSIEDIPIPASIEQAMINQFREVDEDSIELLNIICIFNNAVSLATISKVAGYSLCTTEELIKTLEKKGIILQKINDRGFVFEFYNKILKRIVYNRLSDYEKKSKHKKAAEVLEALIDQEDREHREELIYHLEMAGDKNKLIRYSVENAERLERLNIREGAIKNIEKAISVFEGDSSEAELMHLLLRLGDIHRRDGNAEGAIENFQKAVEVAIQLNETRSLVDGLCKLAYIYHDKNEIMESTRYLNRAEEVLSGFEYMEGWLRVRLLRVILLELKQEYDKALDMCNNAISLCGDKYLKLKGRLLNVRGNLYIDTARIEEAMKSYEDSISCLEKVNYLKGILNPLNNIGVIYGDYYQEDQRAIECFLKMKEISEKNNFHGSEITALVNIGETYFYNWRHEEAQKWFEDALERAEKFCYEGLIFYSYLFLSNIHLLMSDYKNANKYFELANGELLNHPDQGRAMAGYYRIGASLLIEFGQIENARRFIENALEKHGEEESILRWNSEIILLQIRILQADTEKELDEIAEGVREIVTKIARHKNRAHMIYDTVIVFCEHGYERHARKLVIEYGKDIDDERIQVKKLYIDGILGQDDNRIDNLNKAMDIAVRIRDKNIQWKICRAMGDYYFIKGNYFYAVNFYFDACELVKAMVLSLPEKYRVGFVNFHNINATFHRLYILKRYYNRECENGIDIPPQIRNLREIEELFEYTAFRDILTNKDLIRSAQDLYDNLSSNSIKSIRDIITHIYPDPIKNLETIIKYLSRVTLAESAFIVAEGNNRSLEVLASSNYGRGSFNGSYITDVVRSSGEAVLIMDKETGLEELRLQMNSRNVKALICMPLIVNKSTGNIDSMTERRASSEGKGELIGYIYLESSKILNNFNRDTLKVCRELSYLTVNFIDQHKLKISSSIDKLTGTLTRKFLEDSLDKHVQYAESQGRIFSNVIFDLDNFKGINDSFGHQTGDEVLRETCNTILKGIREIDICGRYGGEEFIIILPDTDEEGAKTLSEKLRRKIEDKKILGDRRTVTISMGISCYPQHGSTSQELIEKADQALYVAKERGRNRIQVWQKDFTGKVKGTDKLSGVISGNAVQDYRNVSVMIDILDLIKKEAGFDEKAYELLGRIIEITESHQGILFTVENGKINKSYCRKIFHEGWIEVGDYNKNILNRIFENKQGLYMIDWDEIFEYDAVTGIPDWKSVTAVPIISSGDIKGILYLSVSTKEKEFRFEDYNFISTLAQMAVGLL
jgi:diguanylate cyclase (GGDEF)-like protein